MLRDPPGEARVISLHLGIDPGIKGAWALLDDRGRFVTAQDMPIGEDGRIDAESLHRVWSDLSVASATIEKVGQITRIKGRAMGISGRFNFGWSAGVPDTVLRILGVPVDYTDPTVWKPGIGVTAEKATPLAMARRLWPSEAAVHFKRVKHADWAEAALIGLYGLHQRALLRRGVA